jgi:hypothetical protein
VPAGTSSIPAGGVEGVVGAALVAGAALGAGGTLGSTTRLLDSRARSLGAALDVGDAIDVAGREGGAGGDAFEHAANVRITRGVARSMARALP